MKRTLLFILTLVLTLSLACPAYGATTDDPSSDDFEGYLLENDLPESEGWIQPSDFTTYASASASVVFKKTSSSTCKAQVIASRTGASKVTSKIYVQINNGGTYNTISNGTATKTVNDDYINHIATFTISKRKTYRVKVAVSYISGGTTYTNYYYKSLDSNGY